jgi:hypothetical protein
MSVWFNGSPDVDASEPASVPVLHRSGVTAADKLAVPAVSAADVATGGGLLHNTAYKASAAAYNRWGPTTAPAAASVTTADDASDTHMVRIAVSQSPGADGYDIFMSTDANPKWVGRITEAERAAGVAIRLLDVPSGDLAAGVAGKIRTALAADTAVNGFFVVSGAGADVILTARTAAANDATLNISTANGTCAGLTAEPTSANTTAGVAPVLQVETATVVETVPGTLVAGNATVIVTASGMTGSPRTVSVAVATNDTAAQVAAKIATALGLDADVSAFFTVTNPGGAPTTVVLTSLAAAANDATMNIDVDNGTCSGLTDEPTSVHTTAGVAGVLQVETATVVGTITTAGNAAVVVTAAGMTGSPHTVPVAVSLAEGVAGSVDVGLVGTGVASTAAPFAVNNAYTPGGLTPINCSGWSKARCLVALAVADLRSAPSLILTLFYANEASPNDWHQGASTTLTLLAAVGEALEQQVDLDVGDAASIAVLVESIAGQGAACSIWVGPG